MIFDDKTDYSTSVFIPVANGDIVAYLVRSFDDRISLITLYDENFNFKKSIASGHKNTGHKDDISEGFYTCEINGYIKITSYGQSYSNDPQFVLTNSSELMPNDISIKNPNVKELLIQANRRTSTISSEYWNHSAIFTLLHFSDIHKNFANLDRIVKYKKELGNMIDDAVCTGDMVKLKFSEGFDWWNKFGAGSILTCIGNHDCTEGAGSYGLSEHSQAELYDQYIKPYISIWEKG